MLNLKPPRHTPTLRIAAVHRYEFERQQRVDSGGSEADARRPEGDRVMRLHAQTATIENGFVWLPEEAPWLADYLAEFAAFPRGRHDDQVELHRPGAGVGEPASVCSGARVLDRAFVPGGVGIGQIERRRKQQGRRWVLR